MMSSESVALSDQNHFKFISGLWTGDKEPLTQAAVLRSTNFRGDGFFDYSDIAELQVRTDQLSTRKLERGDIVIERSGGGPKQPVGRVAVFDPPDNRTYATSNFTTALRVVDRSAFEPHFVNFFLHSLYLAGDTESLQRATTGIRNLDWAEYQAFAVPKLPLDEQRLIAKLLLRVYLGSVVNTQQLEILADLKRAAMRALFTKGLRGEAQKDTEIGLVPESWDVVDFAEVREWLQYGTSTHCTYEATPYPVLRIPNIEPGYVKPDDLKYAKLSKAEAERYVLQDGDLIFIRTNGVIERLGACAVFAGQPEGALFASYLIRARLKPDLVEPRFVAYFYASDLGTSIVAGRATPAADGKYNLNTGTIDSLPLPLPPTLDEQREIVAVLDAIDRKIDLHKKKRTVLDELFKALLHKLMTGEIRVADLDLSALQAGEPEGAAA